MINADKKKKTKAKKPGQKAQTAPVVLMMTAVLSIFAVALMNLTRYNAINLGRSAGIIEKDELAQVALEHAMYKLQTGSNWDTIPLKGFSGYDKEYTTALGKYALHVQKGNLFNTGLSSPYPQKQGETNYRTIGMKVKTKSGYTGQYLAVINKVGFGGPIVSKGRIDLPCETASVEDFEPYWGDIYSANPAHDSCRIPKVPVGNGNHHPQDWKPHVFAKGDIYTAISSSGSGRGATVYFDYTYTDMSPTANCHPFSPYAEAPEIDFEYYKMLAKRNNAYYGPAVIGGTGDANPYYIDASHTPAQVTNANTAALAARLTSITPPSVLFVDTTDALPLRPTGASCNSYALDGTARHLDVTEDDGSDGTLMWYVDEDNQISSKGLFFIMGPLILLGDDPDNDGDATPDIGAAASVTCGTPDNFYFPRQESNEHFVYIDGNTATSYLGDVKHTGLIYCGGELRLGGGETGRSATENNNCVYGTLYIGELGSLTAWSEGGEAHIYYNSSINIFGFSGNRVQVVTFNQISFLVPTPNPVYPTSF